MVRRTSATPMKRFWPTSLPVSAGRWVTRSIFSRAPTNMARKSSRPPGSAGFRPSSMSMKPVPISGPCCRSLAIGEDYSHIYKTMIYESVLIGLMGSFIGTSIGLLGSLYLQYHGLDLSSMMKNATILMPAVFHTRITTTAFFIGFIPGLVSTVIGTMLSGIGIYKRKTAQLFNELEA